MPLGDACPLPMPSPSFGWSLLQSPSRTPVFSKVQICDASPLLELCLSFSRWLLPSGSNRSSQSGIQDPACTLTSERQRQAWSCEETYRWKKRRDSETFRKRKAAEGDSRETEGGINIQRDSRSRLGFGRVKKLENSLRDLKGEDGSDKERE